MNWITLLFSLCNFGTPSSSACCRHNERYDFYQQNLQKAELNQADTVIYHGDGSPSLFEVVEINGDVYTYKERIRHTNMIKVHFDKNNRPNYIASEWHGSGLYADKGSGEGFYLYYPNGNVLLSGSAGKKAGTLLVFADTSAIICDMGQLQKLRYNDLFKLRGTWYLSERDKSHNLNGKNGFFKRRKHFRTVSETAISVSDFGLDEGFLLTPEIVQIITKK